MTTQNDLQGRTVLVAGAGLAGLSAAVDLEEAGARVHVCEARERVGGRVWTIREGFVDGQHAEAGGDLIEDGQTEIVALASRLGLKLVPILLNGFTFAQDSGAGPVMSPGAPGHPWRVLSGRLAWWRRAYQLAEQRWESGIAHALAQTSVAQWIDEQHDADALRPLVAGLRGFFLADPEQLSLLALVDQLVSGEASGQRFYRIEGGNDQLASRLVARLQQPVLYRTTLEAVSQSADRVTATLGCEDGSHTQMSADYLVAAMPAATLHDVQFQPTLPEPQRKALAHLPFGRATKALLQFDQRYWSKHGRPKAYGTTLPIGALWDGNEEQRGEAGILTLLAGGSGSDQTRDRIATHGLGSIVEALAWLGGSGARLLASRIISWEADRWARGGYAYFPPAFDPTWRSWLSRPHGRVFFAGEHTSQRWQGYMNGAVESGLRAAAEVRAAAWLENRRSQT